MTASAAANFAGDRAGAFRAARRHTFLVRGLRFLLPMISIAGLGYYGVTLKGQFSVGAGTLTPGVVTITADDLKMKNPSYFGVTKDDGKYNVRAQEAVVDITMTGPIKLVGIDGDLVQANGATTTLVATRGLLERDKNEIQLFDGVDIKTTSGMTAKLRSAHVFAKEHRITSREPLTAEMPTGTLFANTMELKTDKRQGLFGGKVALRLTPSQDPQAVRAGLGLGGDEKKPIEIWSETFAIDDLAQTAAFTGGVIAQQGETQLKAPELHMVYESKAANSAAGAAAGGRTGVSPDALMQPGGQSQLKTMQARGGVVITAGTDRRVVADSADFDMASDVATLNGHVEVTQDKSVLRGGRLWLDRKNGKSRLDSPPTGSNTAGRIAVTLVQSKDDKAGARPKAAKPASDAAFGAFKSDPNAPIDVDASTLDVNDTAKTATFKGGVVAKQGDVVINSADLVAFYTGHTGLIAANNGDGAKSGSAQMSKIETHGGTVVRSKDGQEATADTALFDVKANTILMQGKDGVLLKQGLNMTRGARLKINLNTGEARLENDSNQVGSAALQPNAAQASIAAKAGVAPPPQPNTLNCGGQQCAILFPEQLKEQNNRGSATTATTPGSNARQPRGWQPSTSPSQVYRSN